MRSSGSSPLKLGGKKSWVDGSAPMPKDNHFRRRRTKFRPE